jgi:hypothetical protein
MEFIESVEFIETQVVHRDSSQSNVNLLEFVVSCPYPKVLLDTSLGNGGTYTNY